MSPVTDSIVMNHAGGDTVVTKDLAHDHACEKPVRRAGHWCKPVTAKLPEYRLYDDMVAKQQNEYTLEEVAQVRL